MAKKRNCNILWSEAGEKIAAERIKAGGQNGAAWQEYPRPQLKRDGYLILNGEWELNGESICVPFPPQAQLSEFGKKPGKDDGQSPDCGEELIYRKQFEVPASFTKERILLHFGAVDQICQVLVNGVSLGRHEGGYLPFTFDITDVVNRGEANVLEVYVIDTLSEDYPYGKQSKNPSGMWYTPVSGIWQTVWLENVPGRYISKISLTPDLEGVELEFCTSGASAPGSCEGTVGAEASAAGAAPRFEVTITLGNGEELCRDFSGSRQKIRLTDHVCADGKPYKPVLWTTENPHLYPVKITFGEDCVETYFALRTIDIRQILGVNRVCLNGEPIFLHGVLDQGYFCDGIFLPAEEAEYERDILRMKELGFNMLRKHIKIEPEAFYYYCDKHGMLVVQDMVNSGHYHYIAETVLPTIGFKKKKDTGGNPGEARRQIFREHTRDTIDHLYNHPCIVMYTIFNEGWGQFESDSLYEAVKAQDPTRLIDSTSGWFAQEKSDFDSEHIYFRAEELKAKTRPMFLSECGGYSLQVADHYFNKDKVYGYGKSESIGELTDKILEMYQKMVLPSIESGLCGCVYTQLSDVEDEINGLYTYDRKVCKVEKERFQVLAEEISRRMKKA